MVATGGCFDLLHSGHVATLEAARALGDFLVVCLNSDESVRRLKGPQRPLQRVEDRARVLAALRSVDAVVVFDEDTPVEALRRIRPQVWVKGGDYSGIPLPEASVLADWGGEVVTVPYVAGKSTSEIVVAAPSRSSVPVTRAAVALALRALGLGDFLTGLPALSLLKQALPDHSVVLAAPAVFAPLVPYVAAIDHLLPAR